MYSIFNSYLLKLTGTVAGLAFFSFALKGQETAHVDSIKTGQTEKVQMPYHVKGRVVDAVTGLGFAGARITTPDVNVSAMTDENGDYETRIARFAGTALCRCAGIFPTSGSR